MQDQTIALRRIIEMGKMVLNHVAGDMLPVSDMVLDVKRIQPASVEAARYLRPIRQLSELELEAMRVQFSVTKAVDEVGRALRAEGYDRWQEVEGGLAIDMAANFTSFMSVWFWNVVRSSMNETDAGLPLGLWSDGEALTIMERKPDVMENGQPDPDFIRQAAADGRLRLVTPDGQLVPDDEAKQIVEKLFGQEEVTSDPGALGPKHDAEIDDRAFAAMPVASKALN